MMRIIVCMIMVVLLFPFAMKTNAALIHNLDYNFYCIANAGPENADFELFIRNNGDTPIHFEFPSSKLYEISVFNSTGKKVYVYSKGRYFLQAFQRITIQPHKTFKRIEKWDYLFAGKRIPKGEYTVQSRLLPVSINDKPVKDRKNLQCGTKMFVSEANPIFQQVMVDGKMGNYRVKGETTKDGFFYTVEDGHKQLISEQRLMLKKNHSQWKSFSIKLNIPKKDLIENGTLILNLYERNKEGKIINNYPLVLERFYMRKQPY